MMEATSCGTMVHRGCEGYNVHPQAWSTPPWAEAGEQESTVMLLEMSSVS